MLSAADDGLPKIVRSLALTSHALGLTATLDLAEVAGNVATPAEYRKGRPRRKFSEGEPAEADEPLRGE